MLKKIGRLLGGDPHKREIERLSIIAQQINELEASFEALSNDALCAKTNEFRQRLSEGETLYDLLPEAFAAVREASKRTIGLRHYDVQLIGGTAMHEGKIVEMRTGEGKTLVATLPVYLNALTQRGVHLVTVNDYLARRDARWMAPIYDLLGMSVGVLQMANRTENGRRAFMVDLEVESAKEDQHQLRSVHRKDAYLADITYGTNNEFGFDYLRDNLTMRLEDRSQRPHYFAIIDEVDNVLIDEARTPLIISGPAHQEAEWYERMAQVVRQLNPEDYEINERDRSVTLTEAGVPHVEQILDTTLGDPDRPEDITPEQARILGHLEQALRAQFLYRRNKDYLVQGSKVVIIDDFTGRLMPGRRWSEGLHQAVEAKEGVNVEPENVTYATITLQNYFRMYEKLAGMTGTALTEEEEFHKIYTLEVLQLPTNLEYTASLPDAPLQSLQAKDEYGYRYTYYSLQDDPDKKPAYWKRKDYPDVVYRSEEAKLRAIVKELAQFHVIGRPQLVGTTSVENSDMLSTRLSTDNIRKLLQVLLIRDKYCEVNNIEFVERAIPELQPLNSPLDKLETGILRQMAREVKLSLSLEKPENLERLYDILGLLPIHEERLIKVIQGGVPHQVLNARKHDEESQIIAKAGAFGAVTIATNMAGRGVDIKLGGEIPEELVADVVRVLARSGVENPYDMTNEERKQALLKLTDEDYGIYEEAVKTFIQSLEDMKAVRTLGGLHVIGSERHEARRIDNQLRGRAARQGDPGSSRFYLSLEDDLMRIFGGQQADALFKRLNVDENMPIEHNLLGRLVEQSQERVEGSNFDIRKHLLEYDDVLNSQRQRIYSQRDRVFTKENLDEDVQDMLKTEMARRVPQALEDESGPWKLLAYLEETQPPIDFEDVVYPSYTQHLLLKDVHNALAKSSQPGKNELRAALLDLADRTLQSELNHLLHTTRELIERTEDTLESRLQERLEILDNFFDTLEEQEEEEALNLRPQDMLSELTSMVHVPLKLTSSEQKRLLEGEPEIADDLKNQITAYFTNIVIMRLSGAVERRLGETLDLRANQLKDLSFDEAADQIYQAMQQVFERRMERLLGDQGQIGRDLDAAFSKLEGDLFSNQQLSRLMRIMAQGSRMVFDKKTHRQGWMRYARMNYVYLVARLLEGLPPEEVTSDVLEHLTNANEALQLAWGKMEWTRLLHNEVTISQLDERVKELLKTELSEEKFNAIAEVPLIEIATEEAQIAWAILGKRLQNEVLRHILLTVISEQWVEYLTQVEALRVSIGLEAYAQRDPLVMYKSKATEMFSNLLADIRSGVISRMFTYRPRKASATAVEQKQEAGAPMQSQQPEEQNTETETKKKRKRRKRH